ncbi:MAG: hypothetical protein KAX84_15560, partial [Burkholderiales bacterium]|nr:hypothetical protein [Burkholderiales bacterium]
MCRRALPVATGLLAAVLGGAACAQDAHRWSPELDYAVVEARQQAAPVAPGGQGWSQWGQNARHTGAVAVAGQSPDAILADIVVDPFAAQQQAEWGGSLVTHYPAPLVAGGDVYMLHKSGTYVSCSPSGSGTPFPCGNSALNSQVWNIRLLRWEAGELAAQWTFESTWKPPPFNGQYEPVFHAALAGDSLYVPGAGGTVFKLDRSTGEVLAQINPFGAAIDADAYVAGPLTADDSGNIYYNAIRFDPVNPWSADVTGSWLVKVTPKQLVRRVAFSALLPGAPVLCTTTFTG